MEMPSTHPRWGIEFDWLAVDSQQQVALFTSAGYGAVPETVLRNVSLVDRAVDAIAQLPAVGKATEVCLPGDGDYSSWLTTAQRGFFTYDWTLWHGPYQRLAIPTVPIILEQLPTPIRQAAELVNFTPRFPNEAAITIPCFEPE
ncbi:hypothetical protein [Actinophytocola sediminis]